MISRNRSVWDHHDLRHKTLGFHVELNVTVSRSISVLVLFHEPPESGNLKQQHKIHPTLLIGLHFSRNMIAKREKKILFMYKMHTSFKRYRWFLYSLLSALRQLYFQQTYYFPYLCVFCSVSVTDMHNCRSLLSYVCKPFIICNMFASFFFSNQGMSFVSC